MFIVNIIIFCIIVKFSPAPVDFSSCSPNKIPENRRLPPDFSLVKNKAWFVLPHDFSMKCLSLQVVGRRTEVG